jgi:hypothetical protein
MQKMNRRFFIGGAATAAMTAIKTTAADIKGSSSGPVVETTHGKIRGAQVNKVYALKGIS